MIFSMFKLFESPDDPVLRELQETANSNRHKGTPVVAAKNSIVDLVDHTWAKRLLSHNEPYLERINHNVRAGNVVGAIPSNYLIPYPISQWVLQINYSTFGEQMPVEPHYDTPDYVCVCLLEDFPMGYGGILKTESDNQEYHLSKAGECVVLNGSKVKHWVTQNDNPYTVRKTLVISLMDNRHQVVKLDHMNPIRPDVVREWLTWCTEHKVMTPSEMVKTLISKL